MSSFLRYLRKKVTKLNHKPQIHYKIIKINEIIENINERGAKEGTEHIYINILEVIYILPSFSGHKYFEKNCPFLSLFPANQFQLLSIIIIK